jgi:hypothetical protein
MLKSPSVSSHPQELLIITFPRYWGNLRLVRELKPFPTLSNQASSMSGRFETMTPVQVALPCCRVQSSVPMVSRSGRPPREVRKANRQIAAITMRAA